MKLKRICKVGGQATGFTLIELVLASGLLAILMIGVFALIDGSLSLWRRTETRRNLTEQGSGVMELLSRDLRALEGGSRGDLLVEWVQFDTDGDGLKEMGWPRMRFVRQASRAELTRMFPTVIEEETENEDETPGQETPAAAADPISGPGLIEVCRPWFP
jgi:type II secretory pathway pseudopilin PulG